MGSNKLIELLEQPTKRTYLKEVCRGRQSLNQCTSHGGYPAMRHMILLVPCDRMKVSCKCWVTLGYSASSKLILCLLSPCSLLATHSYTPSSFFFNLSIKNTISPVASCVWMYLKHWNIYYHSQNKNIHTYDEIERKQKFLGKARSVRRLQYDNECSGNIFRLKVRSWWQNAGTGTRWSSGTLGKVSHRPLILRLNKIRKLGNFGN